MRPKAILLLVVLGIIVLVTAMFKLQERRTLSSGPTPQPLVQEIFTVNPDQSMKISSVAFEQNGSIPSKYTCDGSGINPPLSFSDVPPEAKSLALFVDDPDTPSGAVFDHWVVWNIPPSTESIGEGEAPVGMIGPNTSGTLRYYNPCPPDGEHRYFFKLYALDIMLDLPAGSSKTDVEQAMQGHVLAQAELIGRYNRR